MRLAYVVVGLFVPFLFVCSCSGGGGDPASVGTPCMPSDENSVLFHGFNVTEDVIEVGNPACGSGVCLINHFQGRSSCPLGQPKPLDPNGNPGCVPDAENGHFVEGQGSCAEGQLCVAAGSTSPGCDPEEGAAADEFCAGLTPGSKCNEGGYCECATNADCIAFSKNIVACDAATHQCLTFVCHTPGACQDPDASPQENQGKACCLPGTDKPVANPVCGACLGGGGADARTAENTVYCTCRCGVADGAPEEPDFPFCACPVGFECTEIRKNLGLGDAELTGKYCIKAGTAFTADSQCGQVDGAWQSTTELTCAGVPTGNCDASGGACD